MAFILKSAKFIHCLIECSRQRAVTGTGKNVFFSMIARSSLIQKVTVRSIVSVAAEEQSSNFDLDQSFLRLNDDVRSRKVFLESAREVFDVIKHRGEITEPQLILLLKCCSEVSFMSSSEERIQFAEEIWKAAVDFGVELNINHYNALLSIFLENNHKFSPSEFLKELEEKGIEPNLVTYRRFLKAFCQKGDVKGASSILEKMRELDFSLTEEDFNALIQCHCEMGEFHKADEILKIMEDRNIERTGKTYLNLLCGYAKHGQIGNLMDLLEKLPDKETCLSCSDFLEIIYTLAVNNYNDHIDKVLEKLTNGYERVKGTNLIIQRLLHQKMDSLALKLFEQLDGKHQKLQYVLTRSRFILRHFALYRNPHQTLNICIKLEEKGLAKSAVSFVLGQVFHYKNPEFCLNFLRVMMQKNINVRSQYFWPLLIQASKERGNSKLLHILNTMPPLLLRSCQYTTTKVVFPNYKFSENWEADNEVLAKAGLPQKWLSVCFLEKLLLEEKFEDVERLVSSFPVDIERCNHIFNILIDCVQVHPEVVERLLNIVYCLAHDFKLRYNRDSQEEGDEESVSEAFPESSSKSIFDIFVAVFLKLLRDEKVFEQVLQKMLERKFGISTAGASTIIESKKVSNLDNLVKKLSDPGLQIVYDDNLLNLKSQNLTKNKKNFQFKQYKASDEINIEELQEQLEEGGSFFRTLHTVRNMIRIERYEDAISLARALVQSKDKLANYSRRRLYFTVIKELHSVGQYDWAEKAFYLGVDMGILTESDYVLYINGLFERGESSLAVEKYCAHLAKTKNVARCMEFLVSVVSKGSEDNLRQLMTPLVNLLGKNVFMTYLVLAFTENGNFSKAKQLLETKRFTFLSQQFYNYCKIRAKLGTSAELENLLKLVKDIEFLDRVPLYKLLIKKYAEEGNIEKVKKLWLLIEEDDISDFGFLEKMRELMDEPSVDGLKEIVSTFQESLEMKTREMRSLAS